MNESDYGRKAKRIRHVHVHVCVCISVLSGRVIEVEKYGGGEDREGESEQEHQARNGKRERGRREQLP